MRSVQRLAAMAAIVILANVAVAAENAEPKAIWLCVTRPALVEGVQPLAEHRKAEGLEVVVSTEPIAKAIAALERPPVCILLVGDDAPGAENEPWYMPTQRRRQYRWRVTQMRTFATDWLYGDLDSDGRPDVPVGRLPVRSADEARTLSRKIVDYENRRRTPMDLRLVAWAGAPGYTKTVDSMATGFVLATLKRYRPDWADAFVLSADANSAFCGFPPAQPKIFVRRYLQGGLMGVLVGHASPDSFYAMRWAGRPILLTGKDVSEPMAAGAPGPPLVSLSCSMGAFERDKPSLAEQMLLLPAGPVAVVAATAESHPLPNYYTSVKMLQQLQTPSRRLGTLWMRAQEAQRTTRNIIMEAALKQVEGSLGEEPADPARLQDDQVLLYAILGDPAMRLGKPTELQAALRQTAPGRWAWSVEPPRGADRLFVEFRPDDVTVPEPIKPELSRDTPAEEFVKMHDCLEEANRTLGFQTVARMDDSKPWLGIVDRPGTLRLIAAGKGELAVKVFKLERPEQPTTAPAVTKE